jgi:hypothetical protein
MLPDELNVMTVCEPTGVEVPPDVVMVKAAASLVRNRMMT